MDQPTVRSHLFWIELKRNIASKVDAARKSDQALRKPLIAHIDDLEAMARSAYDRGRTIQIIASGHNHLGDWTQQKLSGDPFAHVS